MAIFPLPVTSTAGGDVGRACSRGSSPTTGAISLSTQCEWLLVGKTICYYSEVSRWRSFERLTARILTVKVRESGERKVKRSDTFENITSVIVTLLGNKFTRLIIQIRPHALWTSLQIRRQSSFVTSQRVWSRREGPCIDSVTTWAGWICAALRSSRQSPRSFAALTSWLWTGANTTCRKTVGLVGSTLGTWARRHVSSPELPSSHPPGAFSTWPFLSLLVKVDSSTLPVDQGVFNVIHPDWKKTNIPWYPLSIWEQKKTRQSFIGPASQMWVHMSPASS